MARRAGSEDIDIIVTNDEAETDTHECPVAGMLAMPRGGFPQASCIDGVLWAASPQCRMAVAVM